MPDVTYLPAGSIVYLNNTLKLSEHNRQPVSINVDRIEKTQRMSNGTMRKFHIADKHTINMSWSMLPSFSSFTIDGGYGAVDLKNFYAGSASKSDGALSGKSTFDVAIKYGGTTEIKTMYFSSFAAEIIKRNVMTGIAIKTANITAVVGSGGTITYTCANDFSIGDTVSVKGLDTDAYDVSNALITAANATTFSVTSQRSLQATVTEVSATGGIVTYYASNSFSAGDVVSISGLNTSTITAVSTSSGSITYTTSSAHKYLVGDKISITGINPTGFNLSNATITAVPTSTTFRVTNSTTGTYVSGGTSFSVFNLSNVDISTATDYYFTVTASVSAQTISAASGIASVFPESTEFNVTSFTPNTGVSPKTVTYLATNHDLEVGDLVSINGIRTTATITNAVQHTTAGQVKYTADNTFLAGDIIAITGVIPTSFNIVSGVVVSATSTEFIVANATQEKFRKSGTAKNIYNLQNVTISAATTTGFTVPFTGATGSAITGLSSAKVTKQASYLASVSTKVIPQEFWNVSITMEEV